MKTLVFGLGYYKIGGLEEDLSCGEGAEASVMSCVNEEV